MSAVLCCIVRGFIVSYLVVDFVNSNSLTKLNIVNFFFFFFKQKTAYEIGTGDWSSDVCSSDLGVPPLLNFQNLEAALRGSRATQDDKTWYANSRGQGC